MVKKAATLILLVLVGLLANYAKGFPKYRVKATKVNQQEPLCSSQDKRSIFSVNYNPSYVDLHENGKKAGDALLVRSQNITEPPYTVGPSVLTLVKSKSESGLFEENLNDIKLADIDLESVVFESKGKSESYGVEDPRVVYREKDRTYYMFYTAAEETETEVIAKLALATTRNISDKNAWIRHGPIVPSFKWSKSGSLLLQDDKGLNFHYLIWGDEDLRMAITEDLLHYRQLPGLFLPRRADHFDSHLVEAGPPPLKLEDGNYLYIYNSARKGFPSPRKDYDLQYNAGWIILDGKNPSRIIQRCEEPLVSPELAWEKGDKPYLGLVPNVVFVEAAKPLGNNNFLVFYGGADSVIGSAVITVNQVTSNTE